MRLLTTHKTRFGLASILTLSVVFLIIVVLTLDAVLDVRRERSVALKDFTGRSQLIADGLNDIFANYLYFSDIDALRDVVSVLGSQPNVKSVVVFQPDGRRIVSYEAAQAKPTFEDDTPGYPTGFVEAEAVRDMVQSGVARFRTGEDSLDSTSPIILGREVIGGIQISFDTAPLSAAVRGIILRHVWQGLFLIALGMSLAYLIARYATRPLLALAARATAMGGGDLSTAVPRFGTKESADLGAALDHMRVQLLNHSNEMNLSNQRLQTEVEERTRAEEKHRREAILAEIGKIISSSLDIDEVYPEVAEQAGKIVRFEQIGVSIIDYEQGQSIPTYSSGIDIPGRRPGDHTPLAGTIAEEVARTGASVMFEAQEEQEVNNRFPGLAPAFHAGLRSFLAVPLLSRHTVIGVLQMRSIQPGVYSPRDLAISERIASQIAGAIANAQLLRQRVQMEREMALVDEVGRIVTSTLDIGQVYEQFAGEAKRLVKFDRAAVHLINETRDSYACTYVISPNPKESPRPDVRPIEGTHTQHVLGTGRTLVRSDLAAQSMFASDQRFIDAGLRSAIFIPLFSQGRIIGTLSLRSRQVGAFGPREQRILERLAGQIAPAIANARVYEDAKAAEEEQRRLAQRLARSNTELEQFAYAASHDLQEPLRTIAGFAQLLERRYKGNLDTDADEFIAFLVDGANRMQLLINDLLAYSRLATQGRSFELTDSSVVFDQAVANLRARIMDSGAVVSRGCLPTVMADSSQLLQVFQNLIGNGLKFHGDNPPELHLAAERSADGWLFSVRDNGIGIEPRHAGRIFQMFQRLHGVGKYAGTGIGLAICEKVVQRHGGRIWVESEPGKGATFYFTLPADGARRT